jgi:hypothetical protein
LRTIAFGYKDGNSVNEYYLLKKKLMSSVGFVGCDVLCCE